jgi:NAD(P)H-dependent FMN reductase
MSTPILIVSGTNRPQSNALKVARLLEENYRAAAVAAELFSLAELPPELFNPASYAAKPPAMVAVQQRVLSAAGLHIVTPEYNGSFPGVLKYFIDMLKFPESLDRKCIALVGEAAGAWGALRSVEQLSQIFAYRNAHLYPERVFIADVNSKFNPEGKFTDDSIRQRLAGQTTGFSKFISSIRG